MVYGGMVDERAAPPTDKRRVGIRKRSLCGRTGSMQDGTVWTAGWLAGC